MPDFFAFKLAYLIPLLPLVAAAIIGLFGAKTLKGNSHWLIWLSVGFSAVLSLSILGYMIGHAGEPVSGSDTMTGSQVANHFPLAFTQNLYTWMEAGSFKASVGFFFDPLTAVMLSVVCGIGFLITIFAAGYMKGEAGYWRFFAYLGLFIFSMTCLVMGENLVMLYLGWEGVGLCSYLLIGYYFEKPAAREAAKKAFIVNRIGDVGFAVGIFLLFSAFGTVSYFGNGPGTGTGLLEKVAFGGLTAYQSSVLWWAPFLLMLGAFGKSAQFPLYVWLPDAMEGPTPVSALIHAATMVTAGIYMIARCGTLFMGNTAALITIAVVGCFTALFAGSIALRQNDLKKVFAYSTVSQLGFMFVGVATLAPVAAVFHLVTHAFFKALLFLSSGVIMHAMSGVLDLREMSGLKKHLPKTRILMLIGCLALAGFFPLAGFWSKDEIIGGAASKSMVLQGVLLFTALLTAYYTFRVYFRVFEGPEKLPAAVTEHAHDTHAAHGGHHNHEPWIMILPLVILAVGALFAGVINLPFKLVLPAHALGEFLGHSPSFQMGYMVAPRTIPVPMPEHPQPVDPLGFGMLPLGGEDAVHVFPLLVGGLVAAAGILLAYLMHLKDRAQAEKLARTFGPITRGIEAKYWVDEIYGAVIVSPLRMLAHLLGLVDRFVIDGIVFLAGLLPQAVGISLKLSVQRGLLQGYATAMVLGMAVILLVIFLQF